MTSLALKPPEGHMSSSFLALPREDSTQQTPRLHPLLVALLREGTAHAVSHLSYLSPFFPLSVESP